MKDGLLRWYITSNGIIYILFTYNILLNSRILFIVWLWLLSLRLNVSGNSWELEKFIIFAMSHVFQVEIELKTTLTDSCWVANWFAKWQNNIIFAFHSHFTLVYQYIDFIIIKKNPKRKYSCLNFLLLNYNTTDTNINI